MKDTELAYIAGLIDGEGSVQLIRQISNTSYKAYFSLILSISNTDVRVIEWLLNCAGGHKAEFEGKENRLNSFKWWMSDSKAQDLLYRVRPYVVLKVEQIDLVLDIRFNPLKNTYSIEEEQFRTRVFLELQALHRRGKPLCIV